MNARVYVAAVLLCAAGRLVHAAPASSEAAIVATGSSATFGRAFTEILNRSVRVSNQRANEEEYRDRRLTSYGAFLPTLSAQITDNQAADQGGEPLSVTRHQGFLSTSFNLFRFGSDAYGLNAASRDVETAHAALQQEQLSAEDDAVAGLIGVIAKAQESELWRGITAIKEESLRVARERFRRGLLASQEVDKIEIEFQNAVAQRIDAETLEASARSTLRALWGRDDVVLQWPWRDRIMGADHLEDHEFQIDARPDFQAAKLKTDAEEARLKQDRAALLPSLDLSLKYGSYNLDQTGQTDWASVVTLTIPLFDQFREWSAYRVQSHEKFKAELALEQVRRTAPAELESYRRAYQLARESVVSREKTRGLCERIYSDSAERFRLGRGSVNDLALDQNRLLETQLLEVEGWASAHLNHMRLCHALGLAIAADGRCQ